MVPAIKQNFQQKVKSKTIMKKKNVLFLFIINIYLL